MTEPDEPKNGLGIAALWISITALLSVWTVVGGVLGGFVAIAFGFGARSRVKRGEASNGATALVGIFLSILAIVVGLAFIPIWWDVLERVSQAR